MKRPSRTYRRWAGVAGMLLTIALYGCAPSSDVQELQTSNADLRSVVANDQQQMADLQAQVGKLDDRLTEYEHNGGASSDDKITALNQQIAKLQGQLATMQPGAAPGANPTPDTGAATGENGTGPGPNGAATTDNGNPANSNPAEVASATPPASTAPAPAVPAVTAPTWHDALSREVTTARTSNDPAASSYRSGLGLMQAGRYPEAVAKFQELQRKYPKSPLGEPSEYFTGSALYELGQYDKAILQFNDLATRFPSGQYASPALLREAQAFMQLNDRIDARLTLQKLLNDHPDTPEAASAKSMMQTVAG